MVKFKSKQIKVILRPNIYYYEEENVQFNLDINCNGKAGNGENITIVRSLVEFIKTSENSVQLEFIKTSENSVQLEFVWINWKLY